MADTYLNKTGLAYFWAKIKSALAGKQNTLISGTNIKTVNGSSLLGSGNLEVGATAMTDAQVEAAVDAAFPYTAVTITLTNPYHASAAGSPACTVHLTDGFSYGEQIGQIDSPTGSATIEVPTSAENIGVQFHTSGYFGGGSVSTTGGVTFVDSIDSGYLFTVSGEGTITCDGIDYDD